MKRKKNKQAPVVETEVEIVETPEEKEIKEKKKQNLKKWLIAGISAFLAVIVIAIGIILPIVLSDEYTDDDVYPYAVMKLSNGMTINYEIWEKDCPIASTNFIYLANLGYFDGTVIYDTQGGWVRFGGWMQNNSTGKAVHRGDSDTAFIDKITLSKGEDGTSTQKDFSNNKFGYRLKNDGKYGTNYEAGYLTFCYERSATEFQIATTTAVTPTISGDTSSDGWKSSTFGMVADEQSLSNVKAIYALSVDDGTNFSHDYYKAPLDKNGLIKITSVEVKRKNKTKWKNFDFVDYYYNDSEASSRRTNWLTTLKKTGTK